MTRVPDQERMAIHQAGHAVVQTLVGNKRFAVQRLSLGVEVNAGWPERVAWGEAAIDRKMQLSIYEFGLVTLAGIAAEDRYMAEQPPEEEPLVALSDLGEWREQAWQVFGDDTRIELVSINIMHRLREWFTNPEIWQVVKALAAELQEKGELDKRALTAILARLA